MVDLDASRTLWCSSELTATWTDHGRLILATPLTHVAGGPRTLAILAAFSEPTVVGDALQILVGPQTGPENWMRFVREIDQLLQAGVLVSDRTGEASHRIDPGTFESDPVHIRMLDDVARSTIYQAAIAESVGPDDVVVEIGTGTGFLAVTAAKAGARHVYAIEATPLARTAREVVEANELSDRVTVIESDSATVTLPERGTVLVSEIIGNDPLAEGVLQSHRDALDRLLTPDAQVVPQSLTLMALPVEVPNNVVDAVRFTDRNVAQWQQRYGIDFSPLVSPSRPASTFMQASRAAACTPLGTPCELENVDLSADRHGAIEARSSVHVDRPGTLGGLLLCFDLHLTDRHRITTVPHTEFTATSWSQLLWTPAEPLRVREGDDVPVIYRYDPATGSDFEVDEIPRAG